MQTLRFIGEHALLDQAVEHLLAVVRRIERLDVELSAERLTRLVDLLTKRAVEFDARDLVPVDRRDVRAFVEEAAETLIPTKPSPGNTIRSRSAIIRRW